MEELGDLAPMRQIETGRQPCGLLGAQQRGDGGGDTAIAGISGVGEVECQGLHQRLALGLTKGDKARTEVPL